eukprot:CAMPEP_0179482460 /NCGR_PEP_ID=MMETSP0799-20121207/59976_1 /TAXON_ID=46947 /ORGANISM="Geminigera cryophila, Strain CCMP2564" /LENGTH=86 /DNA_ID=CAMNT_0021295665 /DNA_START=74 /DNA_END=331 /DNA_ORIENTATION=-
MVEDRSALALLADAKDVPQDEVEHLSRLLPKAVGGDEENLREREAYKTHIEDEFRLQQAEDMVWDGEARSLNEAFDLLEQREGARD